MLLPSGKVVTEKSPIYSGSHFTWGEATAKCTRPLSDLVIKGILVTTQLEIENKIVLTAKKLDEIRAKLGSRPIHINSWYRPSAVNRAVGGSKFSRHQFGDAVDIRSNYLSPREIYRAIEANHNFGGISCYYNFVHIDWRGKKARW